MEDLLKSNLDHQNTVTHGHSKHTSVSFVSTTPKQLTRPEIHPYYLSADKLAVTRAGRPLLARLALAQQPGSLPTHQLLCDRKLYTLASYEGNLDDIPKLSDLTFHNAISKALP
jgi:hypothetical protein